MTDNPSALLQASFEHIAATRMADVPILNPALKVEAVGFQPWQGGWLGVLITPWFMNLMFLPPDGQPRTPTGKKLRFTLPSGDYEFLAGEEDSVGPYLSSSLFSPMNQFASHADAHAVAAAVMKEVMTLPSPTGGRKQGFGEHASPLLEPASHAGLAVDGAGGEGNPGGETPDPSRRAFFRRLLPTAPEQK